MKQLLLISCFLFMQLILSAQEHPSYLGVKGGIVNSIFRGNNLMDYPHNAGFNSRRGTDFEIFIETRVKKGFTIQNGYGFSMQGASKKGFQAFLTPGNYASYFQAGQVPKYLYGDFEKDTKLNYITSTSIFKFVTNDERKKLLSFYAGVGMYGAWLLSAKQVNIGTAIVYKDSIGIEPLTSTPQDLNETKSIKKDLRKLDAGFCGIAGVSFDLPKTKIFIEGGGTYGIRNINKRDEDGRNFTKAVNLRIGFSFYVGDAVPIKFFQSL